MYSEAENFWKRFGIVTTAHLTLLALVILSALFKPRKEEPKFIELISMPATFDTQKTQMPQVESKSQAFPQEIKKVVPQSQTEVVEHKPKPKSKSIEAPPQPAKPKAEKSSATPLKPKEIKVSTKMVTRSGALPKPDQLRTKAIVERKVQEPEVSPAQIQSRLQKTLNTSSTTAPSTSKRKASSANWYNGLIKSSIERVWQKPENASALEAYVQVRIKPDGTIIFERISTSSGQHVFDQSLVDAIRQLARIPQPLPDDLGSPDYQIILNFRS
ncbi:MAG: TonB family protein [Verrucomicrobiota bacterium]